MVVRIINCFNGCTTIVFTFMTYLVSTSVVVTTSRFIKVLDDASGFDKARLYYGQRKGQKYIFTKSKVIYIQETKSISSIILNAKPTVFYPI